MGLGRLNPGCGCECSKDCNVTVGNCYVTWQCEEADSVELWWKTPSTGILVHTATNGTYRPAFTGMYTLRSIKNGVITDQTFTVTAVYCPTCCSVNESIPTFATVTGLPPWCGSTVTLSLRPQYDCIKGDAAIIARDIFVYTRESSIIWTQGLDIFVSNQSLQVLISFSNTSYPLISMALESNFGTSYGVDRRTGVRWSYLLDYQIASFGASGPVVGLYGAKPTTGFVTYKAFNEGCSLPSGFSQEYRATYTDPLGVHEFWRGNISVIFHE
jgi:hypothetical protein